MRCRRRSPGPGQATLSAVTEEGSMTRQRGRCLGIVLVGVALSGGLLITSSARGQSGDRQRVSAVTAGNESGAARTINVSGGPVVDDGNPFFRDLGINGRRCVTCHQPGENM